MIVLDLETSGLYPEKNGIWQIGAIDFFNPENIFLEESRIDEEDEVDRIAMKITGKTEFELRDKNKQSQKQLITNFFEWAETVKIKNLIYQNPNIDVLFLDYKARKYNLKYPFHYRGFDIHSIASLKYHQINGNFLFKGDHSDMNLTNILNFCGLEDERIQIEESKITKKGKSHNALEDVKLTAECFSRLIYGNSLLKEYSEYKIPKYLSIK